MKKRNRNILIIVLSFIVVLGGLGVYGVYRLYSLFAHFSREVVMPEEVMEPRILKGADFLVKQEFFKLTYGNMIETAGKSAGIKDQEERENFISRETAKVFSAFPILG
jgi:hypothetical protein